MSDLERVFQMLDIIQGHPGYEVSCWLCHEPMTDVFGIAFHNPSGVGTVWDREGIRHDLNGMCPIAVLRGQR